MTPTKSTIRACELTVSPEEVDAGANMTLIGEVTCSPARDLSGLHLRIQDHDGILVQDIPFIRFDGEVNWTDRITVSSPNKPGTYTWSAQLVNEPDSDPELEAGEATPFSVTVAFHSTRLQVWDAPTAVERGRHFTMKIGLKCSSGCDMTGWPFEVLDHEAKQVCVGEFSDAIWPGSEGLYYAEIDVTAPETDGLHEWQVQVSPRESTYPHQSGSATVRVRVVPPADHTIWVEAVDSAKENLLPGISVVMHPYRTTTNEQGVAELRVARGTYTVFVSGHGYYPMKRDVDVSGDIRTRVPLEVEPAPSGNW